MSLQKRLDAFKAIFESGRPPFNTHRSVVDTLQRATDELIESGLAGRAKRVGDVAPRFVLKDPDHRPVSAGKLIADGPLVLTFYRGVWSPYCNLDLQALQAALPDIVARGAILMAISPQNGVNSRVTIRENRLSFPILGDPRGELSADYGLRVALPDYLVELYLTMFGVDLSSFNDDPSWTLPMPARFVIDRNGIIAYAEVSPDCTRRPDPAELLPVLDRLAAGGRT
ncbi:peroxiredoxin-like family protein [Paraburkholderia sp. BL17N1]|uniref:peroxiredoxin-like family protein n=1 Tax=Paraburkholderia sp. BL17N1 TaxID=1938798 RepID=UPI000EAF7F1E|nr:peroxiredoxin-like family protein [Paraburkholderia sp. BL17N1]RKR45253.1 peroxiredoxin [Paraburkholderia sp. BL17N1]